MSQRKPFAGEPGYVCSLRAPFGHVVVLDRENGAQLGPEGSRWVVAAYNGTRTPLATLPCRSQSSARRAMKEARTRGYGWLGPLLSTASDEEEESDAALRERFIGREERRTLRLTVGDREHTTELLFVNGEAQPAKPHNAGYMRGWNAVARKRARQLAA